MYENCHAIPKKESSYLKKGCIHIAHIFWSYRFSKTMITASRQCGAVMMVLIFTQILTKDTL